MPIKRKRDDADAGLDQSEKQKRHIGDVDIELANIYDQLADENESRRIKAAHKLLIKIKSDSTPTKQIEIVLKRLFRGLCSSRKGARQGFAIALTEILSQLTASPPGKTIATEQVVSLLETSTVPEEAATGQEERDHYFGRLFGTEAIIKSGILIARGDEVQWKRLIELVCNVAHKKPWLRQECGWLLYQFAASQSDPVLQSYVDDVIEVLSTQKLIRNPEGVAVWLAAKSSYPKAKLSRHIWKHGHPLASKDTSNLADIMKDAKSQSSEDGNEAQGAATWSANLHFAWNVVLSHLYAQHTKLYERSKGDSNKPPKDLVPFEDFWRIAVDKGLFGANSSVERKQWGILVWGTALKNAPAVLVPHVFTKNALHCLITALKSDNSYLRKSCQTILDTFTKRLQSSAWEKEDAEVNAKCVTAIVKSVDYANIDFLSHSKLLSTLLTPRNADSLLSLHSALQQLFLASDVKGQVTREKYILDLESKVLSAALREAGSNTSEALTDPYQAAYHILHSWASFAYGSNNVAPATKDFLKERIASGLEQALRQGKTVPLVRETVQKVVVTISMDETKAYDKRIRKITRQASERASMLQKLASQSDTKLKDLIEGVILLHYVLILEIANSEGEAVEVLQELLDVQISTEKDRDRLRQNVDAMVEILLSFAPRPSKFLRTVNQQVFESLAPYVTKRGLESFTRILLTKENAQGQQDMLETVDDDDVEMTEDDSTSEEEELGSDVEAIDTSDKISQEGSSDEPDTVSGSSADENDAEDEISSGRERDEDEELAAFNAALASALGTRKIENDVDTSDASGSDSDMDDDQMLALDEKLTDVFKARKEVSSKKKDRKDTKEAFINFKNRVLDLVEVYMKHEYRNALVVGLIVPLLKTIRATQTKQLADRTCGVLRTFISKCKGQDVSEITTSQTHEVLNALREVHHEACVEASNAHAAVSSSASILLVKVLLHAGVDIGEMITVYGDTRRRQLTDSKCRVQPSFFSDWNNWCAQASNQLSK